MSIRKNNGDGKLPLFSLLPNLITITAICAGLSAIRYACAGNFVLAIQLILLACVLDGLDGRIARLMKTQSDMGAELDSLADFANFGIAPAYVLYAWALHDLKGAGWIAVLFFTVCCVLRLARFNVGSKSDEESDPKYFLGVPAPAGALLVLFPMFLYFGGVDWVIFWDWPIAIYMTLIGLLMASRIPTYSFKTMMVYRSSIKFLLIGFALLVATLLTYPWVTLIAFDLSYFGVILYSILNIALKRN